MVTSTDCRLVVVMVEDNAGDVRLVQEALQEAAVPHTLHVVRNGADAVHFLREVGEIERRSPDLVILDLNLPGRTGRQIMAEMETSPDLCDLPVAVLTTSRSERDIGKEFPRLRSTFAAKTSDFRQLVEIMRRFRVFAEQPPLPQEST